MQQPAATKGGADQLSAAPADRIVGRRHRPREGHRRSLVGRGEGTGRSRSPGGIGQANRKKI